MVEFTSQQKDNLRRILLRERSSALSEKNAVSKLYNAYGEKRETFNIRQNEAFERYRIAEELLNILK